MEVHPSGPGSLDCGKVLIGRRLERVGRQDWTWYFEFGDGVGVLTEGMWRLVDDGGIVVSSEDHEQEFGLSDPLDAVARLREHLGASAASSATIEADTGDLSIHFDTGVRLELLQTSSGYEAWRLSAPDGDTICTGGGELVSYPSTPREPMP